jgi:hypothetical protein
VPTNPADAAHFVYQHGGRLCDDLQAPTYATYDDPLTIEALEWYAALFQEHNVAPTPEQVQQTFGSSADYAVYEAIQRGLPEPHRLQVQARQREAMIRTLRYVIPAVAACIVLCTAAIVGLRWRRRRA